MFPSPLLMLLPAAMAGPDAGRFLAPGGSVAAEDGAGAAWTNPANLGFDPDPDLRLWYSQSLTGTERTLAVATAASGLGVGVIYQGDAQSGAIWGIQSGVSLRLPERFQLGVNATWTFPSGAESYTAWDVGVGYRPVSFFGLGATARNLGSPAPDLGVWAQYSVGAVLRPFGDTLELGFDYLAYDSAAAPTHEIHNFRGTLRLRPIEGLVLRGEIDADLAFGAGLEFYFGGAGAGAFLGDSGSEITTYLATGPVDEWLVPIGKTAPVFDLSSSMPYQPIVGLLSRTDESYLRLLERLRNASEDRTVRAVVIELEGLRLSWAQIEELTAAIDAIQASDRQVIAWLGADPGNGAYLLASTCDRVYLHPASTLDLVGLAAEVQFLAGTLELVGVEAEYVKRSEYKSAPEQWTNREPSPASAEQTNALLDDLYDVLVDGIANGRGLDREQVIALIDKGPYTGRAAIEAGLIDGLLHGDELEDELGEVIDTTTPLDDSYLAFPDTSGWTDARRVAMIYIEGPIVSGRSTPPGLFGAGATGSKTVVAALEKAREDRAVKAVVVRVDSPGGSVYASEEIWRAITLVQEEGKPVVISMGGVAASGGYYVAAPGDRIFAEPSTITGSIGIYTGKFSVAELYDKLGVGSELYLRGRNAGIRATSKPLDAGERAALDATIEELYGVFKQKVADGRSMSLDEVEQVARGRVWSGRDALDHGLVDELGGLQEAIAHARDLAGIDADAEVALVSYGGGEGLLGALAPERIRQALTPRIELPAALAAWAPYVALADENYLALMPYQITVR